MSLRTRVLPAIGIAIATLALAFVYASVTARLGGRIALPTDDAYRYLACAAHRGELCAGSPSVTWSALLALPAFVVREHALVATSFWLGAVLFAITAVGVYAVARRIGGVLAGALAAVATLAIAPFAWAALSGTEVALTAALWVGALALFGRRGDSDTPGFALGLALIALGLARHEAIVVVGSICIAGSMATVTWRGLAAWIAPVVPAVCWLLVSHARGEAAPDLEALRGDGAPLAYAFAGLWLLGMFRSWRRSWLLALTPIAYLMVGGLAPAFPVFAITVGCAAATVPEGGWLPRARIAGAIVAMLALAALAVMPMRASVVQYAQEAADLDRRIAPLVPRLRGLTSIGAHDPGAVALYSAARVIALDGSDPTEGPGARFERLERLAPDRRPTHFVSSATALGFDALLGESLAFAGLGAKLAPRRSWTRGELQLIEARWDHVATAERPLTPHPGWHVVDRVDVADLDDEASHRWHADIGGKQRTLIHRETGPALAIDGGRTILGGERFRLDVDSARPVLLVLRTGGQRQYPDHDTLVTGATLRITSRAVSQTLAVPPPRGPLVEIEHRVPAGEERSISVETDGPYRVFHWFALQPD